MRLTLDLGTELPEDGLLNFCIYISPTPPNLLVLNGNHTLQQVNEKIWRVSVCLSGIDCACPFVSLKFCFFFSPSGEQADGNVLHVEEIVDELY